MTGRQHRAYGASLTLARLVECAGRQAAMEALVAPLTAGQAADVAVIAAGYLAGIAAAGSGEGGPAEMAAVIRQSACALRAGRVPPL